MFKSNSVINNIKVFVITKQQNMKNIRKLIIYRFLSFFNLINKHLKGNASELPEDENTPDKRVDKIFTQMDKVRRVYKTANS